MRCSIAVRTAIASFAVASFFATAAPGSAGAATLYVDVETGDDQAGANLCLVQSAPCRTIGNALAVSAASDEILVDDGDYPESNLIVDSNKVLRASGFEGSDTGAASVDPGNSPSPVLIAALGAAVRIEGFTIGNDSARLVEVNGPATITNNTFEETEVGLPTPHLLIAAVAGDPTISGNVFDKTEEGGTAIRTLSADSPLIAGNRIESYNGSIDIRAGTPQVVGNQISQQTGSGSCNPCAGIYVQDAQPTITANTLTDPTTTTGAAVAITEIGGGAATGAALSRNLIRGGRVSVEVQQVGGSFAPLSLSSDLLSDYNDSGIESRADLTATNVTVASTDPAASSDIELTNNADLTLDSSIVDEGGIAAIAGSTCAITFSRGPTTSGGSCESFQTAADPFFVNPAVGDYRLVGNSLLIDAGNPAAPPAGALDVVGNPRALAKPIFSCPPAAQGPAIRDMGAHEYVLDQVPPVPACVPPGTNDQSTTGAKKKCKKRKGKKAKGKRRCGKRKPKKKR